MPRFSERSLRELSTCEVQIQTVFRDVIYHVDCTILEGAREEARQNELCRVGKSKLEWPNSQHNVVELNGLSRAVDAAPYPIDWTDRERATLFAGYVLGVAAAQGVALRWGGDWDRDWRVRDNLFDDLWHFELAD